MTPISLFTYAIETKIVSGRNASLIDFKETRPSLSTGKYVTLAPIFSKTSHVRSTEGCSIAVVSMCGRLFKNSGFFFDAQYVPRIASPFDSVPPEVKSISSACASKNCAICIRDSWSARFARAPSLCIELGFPKSWLCNFLVTSKTTDKTGADDA